MVSRRIVSSYKARYGITPEIKTYINDMTDAIDVHAHARGVDEEESLHAAQEATKAGWHSIVYKGIRPGGPPWQVAKTLQEEVDRWAESQHLRPVQCLPGYIVGIPLGPIEFDKIRAAVEGGVAIVWMPPVTSAWSLFRLGGRGAWIEGYHEDVPVGPVSWEKALQSGMYLLDEHGKLKPEIRDTIQLLADHDVGLSFGHASPQEMDAMGEEVSAIGYTRAFIDHPFSEVFDFDIPKLKQWAAAGLRFALTWDELSPLLGVDPQDMVAAIKEVGAEHFMLSSDAGIPLLPDTVEAYRLLSVALRAYGVTEDEMRIMRTESPAKMLGIKVAEPVAA